VKELKTLNYKTTLKTFKKDATQILEVKL